MTIEQFFTAVLAGLGFQPTAWRLAVLKRWAAHEGMPFTETWNPLATTRFSANTPLNYGWNHGFGVGNWNSVPVRVYRDAEAGIHALVETLALGYYDTVRACLKDQTGYQPAVAELATYVGSVAYGQDLVDFMNSCDESKDEATAAPNTVVVDPMVAAILAALTGLGPTAAMARLAQWNSRDGEPTGNSALDAIIGLVTPS